jgi:hypothetical protein
MKRLVTYASNNVKVEKVSEPYKGQALDWLRQTKSRLYIRLKGRELFFIGDEYPRDVYSITLKHLGLRYIFRFGQSICNSGNDRLEPSAYSILACVEKNDPGTFENFCSECGYDTDSKKAETTYKAVLKQWTALSRLYTEDELVSLREIN